jgi:hypothetical protein
MEHVNHLRLEVEELTRRIQEHDTGHIVTAIQVLNSRIAELEKEKNILDSSYPDGDDYWK